MPNNDANWTTVSGKAKGKAAPSASSKSTAAPVMPKAETKSIKLSDSAFSSMKDRIADDSDENQTGDVKPTKPVATAEKNPPVKSTKPTKPTSTALTLKQALQNISVDKLKQLYQSSKDNTSLWINKTCYWFIEQLKDVTSGLNDPTFAKETNEDYPLNMLPTAVRDYFNEIFDTQSKLKAIALCRNGITNPNADANVVVGYQVLLQYLLRNLNEQPDETFLTDIDALSASLKRYPSEKVSRLLWAYSQVQSEQRGLALDIWFRLMFPLIENRSYNPSVVENLSQLTTRNAKSKKFLQSNEVFPLEPFIKLLDVVDQPNPALPKELRASLTKSATILSELFSNNTKNLSENANEYFQVLFPVLQGKKQRTEKTQAIINRMILACFTDKSVMQTWFSLHKKFPQSSSHLLKLLQTNETTMPISSKELQTILQKLRTASNEDTSNTDHQEFLRVYAKNDAVVVNKRQKRSKSRLGSMIKLVLLVALGLTIYSNWLWLTVAADYLLEDYLKHPTAIVIKERLSTGYEETKKLTESSLKYAEEYTRTTLTNLEPYVIKLGQYIQQQWNTLVKYIEGPIFDKSIEIAEQVQRLSIVVFNQSVRYLNTFFDWASYNTANLASVAEVYLKQLSAIIYDKWTHFDAAQLRGKFDELRARVVKSI